MLSRDQGLASIAGQLVGRGQPLTRFSSPADVPDWLRPPTRMVVLDYPKTARAVVYRQLRQRYQAAVPPAISWVRLATPTAGQGGAAAGAGATQAVVGVPAARVAVRRVGAARRRRGLWSRHMGPAARQRVNGLLLILAATAALIVGVTLSDGGGCRSTGCRNIAGAAESGGAGIPPSSTIPATPQPGD